MNKNPNKVYLFFENHQRTGFAGVFAKWTEFDAKTLQHKNNWKTPPCNHMGFMFCVDTQWQVAELDYFAGGRIIRNLTKEEEEEKFQLFPVSGANNLTFLKTIREHFVDLYHEDVALHWEENPWHFLCYSLRRYNFKECCKYLTNRASSKVKYSKTWDMIGRGALQSLHWIQTAINHYRGQPQNSGFTCVKSVFLVLKKAGIPLFQSELSPYELMQVQINSRSASSICALICQPLALGVGQSAHTFLDVAVFNHGQLAGAETQQANLTCPARCAARAR